MSGLSTPVDAARLGSRVRLVPAAAGARGRLRLLLAAALLAGSSAAQAQWDLRFVGNYQAARFGDRRSEDSYEELLARRVHLLDEVTSLNLTARLRRDENHRSGSHVFTGQIDGDLRAPSYNLYLRHRPTQRPGIAQPAEWRRRETVFGAALRLEGLPQLFYEDSRRQRSQGDSLTPKTNTLDQRFTTNWTVLGANLDFAHRRTENGSPAVPGQTQKVSRTATDTGGGVDVSRVLFEKLQVGAGWRALDTRWERRGGAPRRSGYRRIEGDVSYRAWKWLSLSTTTSWQQTKQKDRGEPWRKDRLLDLSSALMARPTAFLTATLIRAFQEQTRAENPDTRIDYARAQVSAVGRVLPELEASGGISRNWTLTQRGLSAPSNQANLGLRGLVRRGCELGYSLAGQALEGVADSIRFQVSQSMDLRLQPSASTRVTAGMQTYRLGDAPLLWNHDRSSFRVDALVSGPGGTSGSFAYASQVLRKGTGREKYSLAGQISIPWRKVLLSGSGTASRASGAIAREGRPWGFSAVSTLRLRVHRQSDIGVSFSRSLPAIGSGGSIWQAVLTERFR